MAVSDKRFCGVWSNVQKMHIGTYHATPEEEAAGIAEGHVIGNSQESLGSSPARAAPLPERGEMKMLFEGYHGVLPEGMAVPVALFLSKEQATEWAAAHDMRSAEIKKYPSCPELEVALHRPGPFLGNY